LKLRNYLLSQTGLCNTSTKEESDKTNEEISLDQETLDAVRQFGKKVSELLTPIEVEGEVEVTAEEVETMEKADNDTPNHEKMEIDTEVNTAQVKIESGVERDADNVDSEKSRETLTPIVTDDKSGEESNGVVTVKSDGVRVNSH
jgi:hypothetical protein